MLNNGIHGGNPPNLNAIKTDKDKLAMFVMELLGRHVHLNVDVHELIVANLLRHWDEIKYFFFFIIIILTFGP